MWWYLGRSIGKYNDVIEQMDHFHCYFSPNGLLFDESYPDECRIQAIEIRAGRSSRPLEKEGLSLV